MRFSFVPLLFAVTLLMVPITVFAISNQEAAEKIADSVGSNYPKAAVDVSYQSGKVWLKGTATSAAERKQIIESIFNVSGIKVSEVNDEINIGGLDNSSPLSLESPNPPAALAPVPIPSKIGKNARTGSGVTPVSVPAAPAQAAYVQASPAQALLAPYPNANYPAAYGQQAAGVPARTYPQQTVAARRAPLPGQYNQPNLPGYAWPAYANYPNYSQVSYPKQYSPKAWPYIGPFYPYPQVPLGWRKVTLESHDGWWWLDFDDSSSSGPFSPLYRQPQRYTY